MAEHYIDDKKTAILWFKMRQFQKKLARTVEIIENILAQVSTPMVSFSCGKDSSVLAHLIIQQNNNIPLRFLSSGETRLMHDVDKIIDWFKKQGANIEEINIDRIFSEEWKQATWTEQRKAGNKDIMLLNEGDWDCVFMGLRINESNQRKISLIHHQTEDLPPFCYRYIQAGKMHNIIRCCPLAAWSVEDIAAYIQAYNIPVLKWYEDHGLNSRTTARLTGDAVRHNALVWMRNSNPDGFNKLKTRFPELGLYI